MNQLVAIKWEASLPAFMRQESLLQDTGSLAAAFESRAFARVSTEDNRFALVSLEGDVMPVSQLDPRSGGVFLDLVFITWAPTITKTWYAEAYVKGSDASPACSSADGVRPDPSSPQKQAESCAMCPHNAFGSASNGRGKACSDAQRTAIVLAADTPVILNGATQVLPAGGQVFGYRLPPMTAKYLRAKVKQAQQGGAPIHGLALRAKFVAQGEVDFDFVGYISEDLFKRSRALAESEEAKRACGEMDRPAVAPAQPALPAPPAYVTAAPAAAATLPLPSAAPAPTFAPAPVAAQPQPAAQPAQRKRRRTQAEMAADAAAAAGAAPLAAQPAFAQAPAPAPVAAAAPTGFIFGQPAPQTVAQPAPAAMAQPGGVIQQPAASSPELDSLLDGIMGS